jgi:hypothetical protein
VEVKMEHIFKEIVEIMHHDYAGCNDKKGWDHPNIYFEKMKDLRDRNGLTREHFIDIVRDYLLDFNDHHIHFVDNSAEKKKPMDRGFRVRRYKDCLYVTEARKEKEVKTGTAFISIGGKTIPELKEKHSRIFKENHPEREEWTPIFSLYDFGEIQDDQGNIRKITFSTYEKSIYKPTYAIEKVNEETLLFTLTDFANPDAILRLIRENQVLLETTDQWIIDVRVNYGGSDSSYYPLMPYLMPEEGVELADKEDTMLFNCTDLNSDLFLAESLLQLESIQGEEAQQFLKVFIREWQRNKGKGFVEFNFEEIVPDTFVKGSKNPKSVAVLSDYMCGSSGDSFVELCKKSSKTLIIGRPTKGLNDYANLISKKWDEGFELMYPTSRLSRIDKGLGMTGKGIEPDVYVPWTPEHLSRDIDAEKALEWLASERMKAR